MSTYDDEEVPKTKDSCAGLREDLRACLLATDCVQLSKKTPKACLLEHHPSVPQECYGLRNTFFECKRSLLDNRQRFRGRKGY